MYNGYATKYTNIVMYGMKCNSSAILVTVKPDLSNNVFTKDEGGSIVF